MVFIYLLLDIYIYVIIELWQPGKKFFFFFAEVNK